jgi:anti-sigma regulatory factor (Ser/Thr protein kinase)
MCAVPHKARFLMAKPKAPDAPCDSDFRPMQEWGVTGRKDNAELIVSELVTNAIRAYERVGARADVPVVRIWLACDGARLVIHVWDGTDDMPVRRDAGPDQESGRGLVLVESLSQDWGAYRTAIGKVVWVAL